MIGDILSTFTSNLSAARSTTTREQRTARHPSLSDSTFNGRLEKYLDDYRKGRSFQSNEVPSELKSKSIATANILAERDPKSLLLSGAYSTALSYDQKARFISSLSETTSRLVDITNGSTLSDYSLSTIA